jgi:hypothetical protein
LILSCVGVPSDQLKHSSRPEGELDPSIPLIDLVQAQQVSVEAALTLEVIANDPDPDRPPKVRTIHRHPPMSQHVKSSSSVGIFPP